MNSHNPKASPTSNPSHHPIHQPFQIHHLKHPYNNLIYKKAISYDIIAQTLEYKIRKPKKADADKCILLLYFTIKGAKNMERFELRNKIQKKYELGMDKG